ncbi:MAG: histidine phosphatase family protein [Aureispira sp.]|nr:histidine phosphatase family protein [Aureispira sp.]
MKTLYLIRHAKSSWKEAHRLKDIERPLNKRGQRDAPHMGKVLANMGIQADVLMSSPAVRAHTTAKHIAKALDYPTDSIRINPSIYEAGVEELLQVVQSLENQWDNVLLFGHNMTYTFFANLYAQPQLANVPTCGVVAIQYPIDDWKKASNSNGEFLFFDYPKKYFPKK